MCVAPRNLNPDNLAREKRKKKTLHYFYYRDIYVINTNWCENLVNAPILGKWRTAYAVRDAHMFVVEKKRNRTSGTNRVNLPSDMRMGNKTDRSYCTK